MLDLDAVKEKLSKTGASTLLAFMGGTVPVTVKGRFQGASGQGQVVVEEADRPLVYLVLGQLIEQLGGSFRGARIAHGFPIW